MRIPPYFVGVYWGARQESIEHCADRLSRFFAELTTLDPAVATWYEQARSRKQALARQVTLNNRESILDLLRRARYLRDSDKSVIEEAGFTFGFWNGGNKEQEATMNVSCASFSDKINNSVVLNLPDKLEGLRQSERMAAVLTAVVRAWEPDSGGVMSDAAMKAKNYTMEVPFVDWMFYLNDKLASKVPPLPPPASVQAVDGLGSIIVVQDEPPDHTNPEHLSNIKRVEAVLKAIA